VSVEDTTDKGSAPGRLRVLVTGHHGYIGSVLAPLVRAAGHDVVGLDTFYYRDCDFGTADEPVTELNADVRDVSPADLEGFDAVVHLAALSNDPIGDLNADWTYAINETASVTLAAAAKEAGVGRFVFASSCSMYGSAGEDEIVGEDAPLRPLTAYAESKVRAEEAILGLASGDFTPVSMRNATAYGVSPRLRLDIVLNNLVAWAHATGSIRLQSDGSAWRPLVHIRDISTTALALLAAPADVIRGEAFNVGSADQNYRIRTLAEIVHERLPHCEVTFAEGASADARSYRVDFSKLETTFPEHRLDWTAERGADELAVAYERYGLAAEELQGARYLRLGRLKQLLESHALTEGLRWSAAESKP
jgi:nucleoside-diphosphate-sugar epimerase